jgi:transcription antitermination factor NusG
MSPFVTVSPGRAGCGGARTSQWYAVCTGPRREGTAAEALREQGVVVFMPMRIRWGRLRGQIIDHRIEGPLIPGYLFVLIRDADADFAQVRAVEAVHGFVGYHDAVGDMSPLPIPLAAILEIQTAERRGDYDETRYVKPPFRPKKGDRVKAVKGPWLGFIGKVIDTPTASRALVMIEGPHGRGATLQVAHLAAA